MPLLFIVTSSATNACEEFTVILLAGGVGHRMYPLLLTTELSTSIKESSLIEKESHHPSFTHEIKALLPIANRPMIMYSLEWLENAGFRNIIVVTQKKNESALQTCLEEFLINARMNIDFIGISDDDHTTSDVHEEESEEKGFGTAEVLRKIRSRITTENVMIVSSDIICDAPLGSLLNLHRVHNATLTGLFFEPWKDTSIQSNTLSKKSTSNILESRVFLGVDAENKTKWIYIKSAADVDDVLSIRMAILRR
jgi:translation initiation factor eIF-2B subunit gamma